VGKSLDKQFGRFLRQQRGQQSYAVFAKRLGISASTLFCKRRLKSETGSRV
jgi:DNA-binding Lrp family transcriptional regulator